MNRKRIAIVTLLVFLLALGAFGVSSFAATEVPDSAGGDAAYLEATQDAEYAEYAKEITNYAEENSLTAFAQPVDISRVTISGIVNKTYSGKTQIQSPTLTYAGVTLAEGTDYTIEYKNNVNAGKAYIVFHGAGNFKNKITKSFTINAVDISRTAISGIANKYYTGKGITQGVVVKYGGTTLRNGVNYTLSYGNNKNVGTAKVVIYGKGNFKNRITKTFLINPKGTAVKSISVETNAFTISWAPQRSKMSTSPITGYQIHYCTDRNFKSSVKIITMGNINQTSRRITGLASGGKYYVRLRTYKKIGSKAYMGPWTPVREVQLKAVSGEVAIAYQELNKFRTTKSVWYWNSDNKTKTVFNTNSSNQLKPLARDAALEAAAQVRAKELAKEFSHTRPDGRDCFTAYPDYWELGENIAAGMGNLGGAAVTQMFREDGEYYAGQGHRRNMLYSGYNVVGIASFKANGWTYWVQAFGRK